MPAATVVPELPYADVGAAADRLCAAFGLVDRPADRRRVGAPVLADLLTRS